VFVGRFFTSAAAALAVLVASGCGSSQNSVPPADATGGAQTSAFPAHHASSLQVGIPPALVSGYPVSQITAESGRRTSSSFIQAGLNLDTAKSIGSLKLITALDTTRSSTQWAQGSASTLVLYDTAGQWGFLGELYAMATANLAGHFGHVSTEPIAKYVAGQMNQYTGVIYMGSSYYTTAADAIPTAFYTDVAAGTRPVLWANDNIWNFANSIGITAFENKYGWNPTNSYFANATGGPGSVTQVIYKGTTLSRVALPGADGGILRPNILGGTFPAPTVLAQAVDTSTSPATTFPWAIRTGNLTYIGEIPYSYTSESDRIIAFEDMLFDLLAPTTPAKHSAMFRLEDISAKSDFTTLTSVARYLANANIPYGFNVIPLYQDPLGTDNNGIPQTIKMTDKGAAQMLTVINYMLTHGGTIIDEGYTHQYASVANPYDGVSGNDAEFFRAHVGTTGTVVWDSPVAEDSLAWAQGRVTSSVSAYAAANLLKPSLWVTPHYFATDTDYRAVSASYPARYERSLYFAGTLTGLPIDHSKYIGSFFPYVVQDVYGTEVVPENLGDYDPTLTPPRLATTIIARAKQNLAVRDGYASFFYDTSFGAVPLSQIITGIRNLGYTFIKPAP
jgi:uncharacterized protein YdaL